MICKFLIKLTMKTNSILINFNGSETPFQFRANSGADKGVIRQIFQDQDYNILRWKQGEKLVEYHQQQSIARNSLIIDAGANIGASAVYFSKMYANSIVFSIEPDDNNYQLLKTNTTGLNVFNFHGAISNMDGELAFEDPGRSDWGFMTRAIDVSEKSSSVKKVKSISPASILSSSVTQNTNPLIFKIDIEGGEDALFKGDIEWLNQFPLIIIELHDWMLPFSGSSRNFIKAIAQYDFDFVHHGENIFLFNRSILKN